MLPVAGGGGENAGTGAEGRGTLPLGEGDIAEGAAESRGGASISGAVITCEAGGDAAGGVVSSTARGGGGGSIARTGGGALAVLRGALDNAGAHAPVASASNATKALRDSCHLDRSSMTRGET